MAHISIYLDESGCLGFSDKGSSKIFVITVLKINNLETQKQIFKAVEKTIKRKVRFNSKRNDFELKGAKTDIAIKEYFYNKMPKSDWSLYAVILNKKRVSDHLKTPIGKQRLYNYLAKFILSHIDLKKGVDRLDLYVDKCKNTKEIKNFNKYIEAHLDLSPQTYLNISHLTSHENYALQAVDLFCWGVARKYKYKDVDWYDCFKENILCEKVYLP